MAYTPVAQRIGVSTAKRYVPVAEREEKPKLPTLPGLPSLSGTEIGGIGGETTPVGIEPGIPDITPISVAKFAGGIGQEIARNIASAGVTIAQRIKPKEQITVKPEDFPKLFQDLARTIFRDEPIKSIEQRIVEAEPKVKAFGENLSKSPSPILKSFGKLVAENPLVISFAGITGSVGLDLTPFGGLEKNALKSLIKAKTATEAISVLTKMGVADDLARTFADDIVKVVTEKEAKALFNNIAKIQRTTKIVSEVTPKAYIPVAERAGKEILEAPKFEPIKETGKAIEGKTSFVSKAIMESEVAENLKPYVANVENIKLGRVSDAITDGKNIGRLPSAAKENLNDLDLLLNYKNAKKIIDDHGALPAGGLIKTSNEADAIYLIKEAGEKDKINFVKVFDDGAMAIVGANRIDGYATVTFFESSKDIRVKQKYLNSIEEKGILVFSGGTASRLAEVRYPSSIALKGERVSASLPDVREIPISTIAKPSVEIKGGIPGKTTL